jgi:hypothetical protein
MVSRSIDSSYHFKVLSLLLGTLPNANCFSLLVDEVNGRTINRFIQTDPFPEIATGAPDWHVMLLHSLLALVNMMIDAVRCIKTNVEVGAFETFTRVSQLK